MKACKRSNTKKKISEIEEEKNLGRMSTIRESESTNLLPLSGCGKARGAEWFIKTEPRPPRTFTEQLRRFFLFAELIN